MSSMIYMDSMRAAQLTETITKEQKWGPRAARGAVLRAVRLEGACQASTIFMKNSTIIAHRIQRAHLLAQAATLPVFVPPPLRQPAPQPELPPFVANYKADDNLNMATVMSKSMWAATNPGYVLRDGSMLMSEARDAYTWDESAIKLMRAAGEFSTTHHKRRDAFAAYVEAAARAHQRLGGRHATPATSSKK